MDNNNDKINNQPNQKQDNKVTDPKPVHVQCLSHV